MKQDLTNTISVIPAFAPTATVKASANGITINRTGYEAIVFAILMAIPLDTLSGTTKFELDLQDSPDGTTWSAVPDSLVQYATGTGANTGCVALVVANPAAPTIFQAGYLGIQPYVRLSIVATGTMTNGTWIFAHAILGNAHHNPAGAAQLP